MNLFSKEIKIAITAIIAVVIIYAGAIFMKGMSIFNNTATYYVEMDNVAGLDESGEVLANGLRIGVIKGITFNPDKQNLTVRIDIDPNFQVPKQTTVFVTSSMLGAPKINLKLGANSNGFLKAGDTIYGTPGADLMNEVAGMLPSIEALIPKLDSILSNLNALSGDPALTASLKNLEGLTANLKTSSEKLNSVLGKDVPSLLSKADNVCANVERLTNNVNNVDIAGIANNANQTILKAQSLVDSLSFAMNSKDNTLGMLLNDNSVALHLDSTVSNASLLLEDLRNHPKRYVHFSLFGRKEK